MGEKRKTSRAQWSIINAKDKSHILECGVLKWRDNYFKVSRDT